MIEHEKLFDLWERYDEDYLEFEAVEPKRSNRPDIHAFILLDELVPTTNNMDMICAAEHDKIFLATPVVDFCKVATEQHVQELNRCGVCYNPAEDYFYMFVV